MDFFESQDRARRRTGHLIFFYLLAVALIVASIYFVVLFAADMGGLDLERSHPAWHPELFFVVSAATIGVIALGSVYRILQLRSGGSRVAEMMGGRRVNPNTRDVDERRLVNVVEEMAIASGVPVPEIFVMEEEGINAFAAGYSPSDAAVAVTRGCLKALSRDELQGVIAHEFSHILNGDMRINIRLIGILNGILLLHLIGFMVIRSLRFGAMGGRSRRGGGKGGGGGVVVLILVVGFALTVIGYFGVLCSRMIQAAVSRQREYLADAAAVQFTRNPEGIAGALKKIGGASSGSRIEASHAMEASHMFFANGITSSLSNMFATHPPLTKRIQAIDPSFDGKSWVRPKAKSKSSSKAQQPPPLSKKNKAQKRGPFDPITDAFPMKPEVLLASIGTLGSNHISQAGQILEALPETLRDAAHDPAGAEAIIYGLLLSREAELQKKQLELIPGDPARGVTGEISRLHSQITQLPPNVRLPLIDLAVPALRQLSPPQFKEFRQTVSQLIASDNNLSLFEFALEKALMRHLENHFNESRRPAIQYHSPQRLVDEFSLLLSALAHAGEKDTRRAFAAGQARVPEIQLQLQPPETCTLEAIDQTLNRLDLASFPIKKRLLAGAIAVIVSDGKVAPDEAELLRAVADSLDCPMPPLG